MDAWDRPTVDKAVEFIESKGIGFYASPGNGQKIWEVRSSDPSVPGEFLAYLVLPIDSQKFTEQYLKNQEEMNATDDNKVP